MAPKSKKEDEHQPTHPHLARRTTLEQVLEREEAKNEMFEAKIIAKEIVFTIRNTTENGRCKPCE